MEARQCCDRLAAVCGELMSGIGRTSGKEGELGKLQASDEQIKRWKVSCQQLLQRIESPGHAYQLFAASKGHKGDRDRTLRGMRRDLSPTPPLPDSFTTQPLRRNISARPSVFAARGRAGGAADGGAPASSGEDFRIVALSQAVELVNMARPEIVAMCERCGILHGGMDSKEALVTALLKHLSAPAAASGIRPTAKAFPAVPAPPHVTTVASRLGSQDIASHIARCLGVRHVSTLRQVCKNYKAGFRSTACELSSLQVSRHVFAQALQQDTLSLSALQLGYTTEWPCKRRTASELSSSTIIDLTDYRSYPLYGLGPSEHHGWQSFFHTQVLPGLEGLLEREGCKHLETLDLYGVSIPDAALARVIEGSPRLRHLRFAKSDAGWGKMNRDHLIALEGYPDLDVLDITVTRSILMCKHLRSLRISTGKDTAQGTIFSRGDGWKALSEDIQPGKSALETLLKISGLSQIFLRSLERHTSLRPLMQQEACALRQGESEGPRVLSSLKHLSITVLDSHMNSSEHALVVPNLVKLDITTGAKDGFKLLQLDAGPKLELLNLNIGFYNTCSSCRIGKSIVSPSSSEMSGLKVLAIRFFSLGGERLCAQCSAACQARLNSQEGAMTNDASSGNIIRKLCVSSSSSLRVCAYESTDGNVRRPAPAGEWQASLPIVAPMNLQALSWKSCIPVDVTMAENLLWIDVEEAVGRVMPLCESLGKHCRHLRHVYLHWDAAFDDQARCPRDRHPLSVLASLRKLEVVSVSSADQFSVGDLFAGESKHSLTYVEVCCYKSSAIPACSGGMRSCTSLKAVVLASNSGSSLVWTKPQDSDNDGERDGDGEEWVQTFRALDDGPASVLLSLQTQFCASLAKGFGEGPGEGRGSSGANSDAVTADELQGILIEGWSSKIVQRDRVARLSDPKVFHVLE